jgi:hypothetical protein
MSLIGDEVSELLDRSEESCRSLETTVNTRKLSPRQKRDFEVIGMSTNLRFPIAVFSLIAEKLIHSYFLIVRKNIEDTPFPK